MLLVLWQGFMQCYTNVYYANPAGQSEPPGSLLQTSRSGIIKTPM